jgi:hypothetical protein
MSYQTVTRRGFFGRMKDSIVGIFIGILFVLGAMLLLGYNEYRTVKTRKGLEQGQQVVVRADAARFDPSNQGQLLHLTGTAETSQGVRDPDFGIERDALALRREVEMYQWVERKETRTVKEIGGGERKETSYHYEKRWKDELIDSNDFHNSSGHQNPRSMPYASRSFIADDVRLGAYQLGQGYVHDITGAERLRFNELPDAIAGAGFVAAGEHLMRSQNPNSPQIGDLRMQFEATPEKVVTVVAMQDGEGFAPYTTKNGTSINMLHTGNDSVEGMFKRAQEENTTIGWALRVLGFVVMWIGFGMTIQPLRVLADVIPPVGRVVGAIGGFVTFLLAAILSLLTIVIAWVFSRPLLVLSVLAMVIGGAMLIAQLRKGNSIAAPIAPPMPPPPPPPPPMR